MRREHVSLEEFFWSHVRNRQLGGFKFRRQVPIGAYIADFVCVERKLIVELDGPFHAARKDYDARRDEYLENLGYRIWRMSNSSFADDYPTILRAILEELRSPSP